MFIKDNKATILINSEVTPEMGEELSYFIYGVQFMDDINTIEVNICSGGGSVLAGYAIYSALLNARAEGKTVITICDGIAASIAGIILLAGTFKKIRNYGLVMIHNPSGGDEKTLQKIKDSLKLILNTNFKGDLDLLMNNETWYSAEELKNMGIVDEIIDTEFELTSDNIPSDKVTIKNIYDICNNIIKNNNENMDLKEFFKKKEDNKLKTIVNAEVTPEETPVATDNEVITETPETPETPEEEKTEEMTIEQLDSRITALEQMITQIMEANASLITENNLLKTKKEDEVKTEILNKSGIEKTDFEKWMKLDLNTLTNLTATLKSSKSSPIIPIKNELEGITQEVFNNMNKEDKDNLLKKDKEIYWKLFKNSK
jgi:ATP-dependent protease ClpP protease subunit